MKITKTLLTELIKVYTNNGADTRIIENELQELLNTEAGQRAYCACEKTPIDEAETQERREYFNKMRNKDVVVTQEYLEEVYEGIGEQRTVIDTLELEDELEITDSLFYALVKYYIGNKALYLKDITEGLEYLFLQALYSHYTKAKNQEEREKRGKMFFEYIGIEAEDWDMGSRPEDFIYLLDF